jgi:hypothetical protein
VKDDRLYLIHMREYGEWQDLVAVLKCPAHADVEVGDVGTVVELLPPDGLEVGFLDRDGRTRCVAMLSVDDVFKLNRERTPSRADRDDLKGRIA